MLIQDNILVATVAETSVLIILFGYNKSGPLPLTEYPRRLFVLYIWKFCFAMMIMLKKSVQVIFSYTDDISLSPSPFPFKYYKKKSLLKEHFSWDHFLLVCCEQYKQIAKQNLINGSVIVVVKIVSWLFWYHNLLNADQMQVPWQSVYWPDELISFAIWVNTL